MGLVVNCGEASSSLHPGLRRYNINHMYYVYVLKSLSCDWLYVGYSNDLERRFGEHNDGKVKSTKAYKPFKLIFYEAFESKKDAKRREQYLKTNKGKRVLRLMLQNTL